MRKARQPALGENSGDAFQPAAKYHGSAAVQTVHDLSSEGNPEAKSAKPDDFVDIRFIRELDQSGFIDGLYKK